MTIIKYKYECHKIITWITGREEKGLIANDRSHDPRPIVCWFLSYSTNVLKDLDTESRSQLVTSAGTE